MKPYPLPVYIWLNYQEKLFHTVAKQNSSFNARLKITDTMIGPLLHAVGPELQERT